MKWGTYCKVLMAEISKGTFRQFCKIFHLKYQKLRIKDSQESPVQHLNFDQMVTLSGKIIKIKDHQIS